MICGNPDRCPKHGIELHGYPCWPCQEEWEAAHPHTAEAISKFAAGKVELSAVKRAKKLDAAGGAA